MLDTDPAFRPVRRRDGYLPLEDLSLIGDGSTCALVGLDGAIQWMCVPCFDPEPPGRIGERAIPAYADEPGVDPDLQTETFAEVELELECWRWTGTRFRLRTGKALRRDRSEVAVHFRPVPHLPFTGVGDPAPNVLRFGHDPDAVTLELTGGGPRPAFGLTPLTPDARLDPPALPAYGRVLLDFLDGDATLSIRGDEAEESWRIIEPVIAAWSRDLVPLERYPAGSEGPVR